MFVSLASSLYAQGQTISSYLASLYQEYGHFVTLNSYWICRDPVKTARIFDTLRTSSAGSYPSKLGQWQLKSLRDITNAYDSTAADQKLTCLPQDKSGQMIQFELQVQEDGVDGLIGTIRTSGTEPKIKYYLEGWGSQRDDVDKALTKVRQAIASEWMMVEKEGLEAPAL